MAGDVDGLLDTLSDQVHYHAYGAPDPLSSPEGKEGVRAFYERFIASGAGRLQLDIDRLVVDRDCILTEGVMRMAYPGRTLQAMGITVDDPAAHYLYEARMATLWPFDADGKVLGRGHLHGERRLRRHRRPQARRSRHRGVPRVAPSMAVTPSA